MQAVLLAAGKGVRMLPLTLNQPKPLVEIGGVPLIVHVLRALPPEIDEVIIVVGYKAQMIIDYLGETFEERKIKYVHQWMPAGTAHALSLARPFLTGRFMLMNTDDIMGAAALAEAVSHPLSILVAHSEHPEKFGVVKVRENGTLEEIQEKPEHPETNLVSTGAMVLDTRIFEYEAPRHTSGEYYMTAPLEAMAKDAEFVVVTQPLWIPVGSPSDIPLAEARLLDIEEEAKKG